MPNPKGISSGIRIHCTVVVLLGLSLALLGCVPLPLPWMSDEPRIEEDTLENIDIGVTTREEILSLLGTPDLMRRGNKLWIYGWAQGHGMLITPSPEPNEALYYTYHVLFLEFNESGLLENLDIEQGEHACLQDDVCVYKWEWNWTKESFCLDESTSIITASHKEEERAEHFVPSKDVCGAYLFTHHSNIYFSISDARYKRLDYRTYVFYELEPGNKVLRVSYYPPSKFKHVRTLSTKEFECISGQNVYLKLGDEQNQSSHITISLLSPAQGKEKMNEKRLQLLDNP